MITKGMVVAGGENGRRDVTKEKSANVLLWKGERFEQEK